MATVLEVGPDSVVAEIADDDGRTLDVLTVPIPRRRPALRDLARCPDSRGDCACEFA